MEEALTTVQSMANARKNRLALTLVVGAVLLSTCMGVISTIAGLLTLVPTNVTRVADLVPPVEDRSGRRLDPDRCGLVEVRTPEGCAPARPSTVEELEITFPSRLPHKGIQELRGTLSVPQGLEGPRPGVVIVHGSGPILRDGAVPGDLIARFDPPFEVYRALAELLSQQGLVVLRYDKRTSPPYRGEIDPKQLAFTDFVDDARDGLDFLASRPEVDGQALIVLGHSQGGQLAPHIVEGDDRIAAVLLLGGSTQTFGHLVIEQLERFGEIRKMQHDYLTPLLLQLNLKPLRACFEPIWDGTYDPEQVCMAGVTQQTLADYEALGARTGQVLQAVDAPIFAIQGTVDINIDPAEIPRMQRLLAGRDAELHHVRGLDHSLTDQLDPSDPVRLDEEAVDRILAFLRSVPWL